MNLCFNLIVSARNLMIFVVVLYLWWILSSLHKGFKVFVTYMFVYKYTSIRHQFNLKNHVFKSSQFFNLEIEWWNFQRKYFVSQIIPVVGTYTLFSVVPSLLPYLSRGIYSTSRINKWSVKLQNIRQHNKCTKSC